MPMLSDSSSCISAANKLAERRKEEKEKFDARHQHKLKPLVIGSTFSFLNSDLKTWSVGLIHGRSSDNRSYEILTENGLIISRNKVHLHETNVVFREHVPTSISITGHLGDACKNAESVMAPKSPPFPNKPPTTDPHVKVTKSPIGSNDKCNRTWSGSSTETIEISRVNLHIIACYACV